jgi:uncharacterized protein involved in exopolysaccharide biosynthesis
VSNILRRPWWLIMAGGCIGVLAVLVVDRITSSQVFEARSAVAVDPDKLPRGVLRWDGEIDFEKLRHALLSDAIVHEVITRALPSQRSPEDEQHLAYAIRHRLQVTYTRRTQTIELYFFDSDPLRAAGVVSLFARFFGGEDIVRSATLVVPVGPRVEYVEYLAVGVAGGLVGGLVGLLAWLLGRSQEGLRSAAQTG